MRVARSIWGLVLALALASASARAQDVTETDESEAAAEDRRRAAVMLDRSALAYREGRFRAAAALLEDAYLLSREPILLYNLGRAYEGERDDARAIDAYARYLAAVPDAPNADVVRERIAQLEGEITRRSTEDRAWQQAEREIREAREAEERVRIERERAAQRERASSPLPWVVLGTGGAIVVTGIVLGAVALDRQDTASETEVQREAAAAESDAQALALAANVALVAGAALAAAGLTWGVITVTEPERGAVQVAVGAGSIAVRGRF